MRADILVIVVVITGLILPFMLQKSLLAPHVFTIHIPQCYFSCEIFNM